MPKKINSSGLSVYLRLLKYVKPHWHYFFVSVAGMIMFALSEPAFAKLLEYFTEELSAPESKSFLTNITWLNLGNGIPAIWFIPVLMLTIAVCRSAGAVIGGYFIGKISYCVIHDLRKQIFNKILELPQQFYNTNNTGSIISLLTFSVTQVTEASSEALRIIVREGLTVIFLLGFLLYTSWKMTLVFIAITPLIAVGAIYASKRARKFSHAIQNSMADITHILKEVILGQAEVKSFVAHEQERSRFAKASKNNYYQSLKMDKSALLNTALLQLIVAMALALLLFIVLLTKGSISASSLIGYVTAAALLPKPIKQLSDVNSKIQKGIAAAETVFNLLDKPSELNKGKIKSGNLTGNIVFKNINFCYPNAVVPTLRNINISIKSGQTIALVGRSGSGKTTLINLLSRFYLPTKGDIYIDGIDINDYDLHFLRSQIAVVSQKVNLFNANISDNIAYGYDKKISPDKIKAAANRAHADIFIEKLKKGYNTSIGENAMLLSGGQKQRLAIARALLKDSPIIILDEATAALDYDSENKVQTAVDNLMRHKTTLVIAHRLSTIEKADLVLVMDKGQIIESGTHKQLLSNNLVYSQLYKLQFYNKKVEC